MAYSRKDVEKAKMNAKKFVRYQEGAEKYSMGLTKFTELAKEAKDNHPAASSYANATLF